MKEFFEKQQNEAEQAMRAAEAAGDEKQAEYFRGVAAGMQLAAMMLEPSH